jgi:hypothetical protein
MPSLAKTLLGWYWTVCELMNSRAPISGFDRPSCASRATLRFLGSQLLAGCDRRLDGAIAGGFSGGQQFPAGAFGESFHLHLVEHAVRGTQLFPGVGAAVLATQPFAVKQPRAGQLWTELRAAQAVDRLPVPVVGCLALGYQRP